MAGKCVIHFYDIHVYVCRCTMEPQRQTPMPNLPNTWDAIQLIPTSCHSTRWSSPQPLTNCSEISPASSSDSSIFQSMRKGKRKLLCLQRNIFRDGDFFLDNYNLVQWQPVSWSSPPYLMAISSLWGVVLPNSSQIKQLTGRMRMAQSGTHIASSTSLPCFIFHLPAGQHKTFILWEVSSALVLVKARGVY